jgi:hypothetical protein
MANVAKATIILFTYFPLCIAAHTHPYLEVPNLEPALNTGKWSVAFDVCFGSLATVHHDHTGTTAFGGKPDIPLALN